MSKKKNFAQGVLAEMSKMKNEEMSKKKNENPKLHVCSHSLGELLVQHVKEQTNDAFELEGIEWRPVDRNGELIPHKIPQYDTTVEFLLHLKPKVGN